MTLATAVKHLNNEVARVANKERYVPTEADAALNNASREVIRAMREEHGAAFLVHMEFGLYEWNGETPLQNFIASAVLPTRAQKVDDLVAERKNAPYTGSKDDRVRVEAIFAAVKEAGGEILVWS